MALMKIGCGQLIVLMFIPFASVMKLANGDEACSARCSSTFETELDAAASKEDEPKICKALKDYETCIVSTCKEAMPEAEQPEAATNLFAIGLYCAILMENEDETCLSKCSSTYHSAYNNAHSKKDLSNNCRAVREYKTCIVSTCKEAVPPALVGPFRSASVFCGGAGTLFSSLPTVFGGRCVQILPHLIPTFQQGLPTSSLQCK